MDKKLVAIGGALVALLVFWGIQSRNNSTVALANPAEWGHSAGLDEAMELFERDLQQAGQLLRDGRPVESARKLYHSFPAFESHLNSQGFVEVQSGLTLKAWFDSRKDSFITVLSQEYPKWVAQLKSGDMAWREINTFMSEMPFPFIHELRRTYESQHKKEIAAARAAQASRWCYLSVIAVSGSGENYEEMVRHALRARWNPQSNLKLIFDRPSSGDETRAAAKIINVSIDEKFAQYAFQGDKKRDGGQVAESATVHFRGVSGNPALKTNWELLPALSVTNEAPEVLTFKFENKNQMADFSAIAARQRKSLETKLSAALQSIPPFQVVAGHN